jgi:hypothetical protein
VTFVANEPDKVKRHALEQRLIAALMADTSLICLNDWLWRAPSS